MNTYDEALIEKAARILYSQAVNGSVSPDPWPAWDSDDNHGRETFRDDARAVLDAVAPLIASQALRDAADEIDASGGDLVSRLQVSVEKKCNWLRERADLLDSKED